MKAVFERFVRIGKTAALIVGLAVLLAVMLRVATTALAAAPGDPFRLGKVNSTNKFTKLIGASPAPRLILDNNRTGPALRLLVEPGKPPMQVSSAARVPRLNADKVNGKDASQLQGQTGLQGEQGTPGVSGREVVTGSSPFNSDGVKATGAACPPARQRSEVEDLSQTMRLTDHSLARSPSLSRQASRRRSKPMSQIPYL